MKVSEKLLISFTENLSTLINSGLSVMDALSVCKTIDDSKNNVQLCNFLLRQLSNGDPLYEALKIASSDFNGLYVSLVKIGEKTGNIHAVLKKLSEYLNQKKVIKDKIKSSLSYPLIVFATAIIVILIIMFFVFPKLESVFEVISDGNKDFEEISGRIRLSSSFVSIFVLLVFVFSLSLFLLYKKSYSAKCLLDKLCFKIPFLNKYTAMICTYDFAFSMKLLCSSGIQIVGALEESKDVVKNEYYKSQIDLVKDSVAEGNGFSQSLADKEVFPKYLKTWMGIGETIGNVSNVFDQVYQYYTMRTDYILKQVAGNAESVFILITGIVIFALVCQFVLPIFNVLGRV